MTEPSKDRSTLHVAVISAITAVTTAAITAGTTVYTTGKSATKSAESAANQASIAQAAAGQAQSRLAAVVPPGAVVAFQSSCPEGWLPFDAANGRFILGVDDTHPSGAEGGRAEVIYEYVGEGQYSTSGTASYRPSHNQPGVRDGDKVMFVSSLPPFVALRYCVKT